jgi:hypothetical protein
VKSDAAEKISFLQQFKADIIAHFNGANDEATRVRINRGMRRAKQIVSEAGAMKTITLSPPPAIGGMIVRDGDPFAFILQDYYGMSMVPTVADIIEEAIGYLESPEYVQDRSSSAASPKANRNTEPTALKVPPTPGPELPEKVTLSWLVRHVPISFWFWLIGLLAAALALGTKLGPLLK